VCVCVFNVYGLFGDVFSKNFRGYPRWKAKWVWCRMRSAEVRFHDRACLVALMVRYQCDVRSNCCEFVIRPFPPELDVPNILDRFPTATIFVEGCSAAFSCS
jgi:hypothetical protein